MSNKVDPSSQREIDELDQGLPPEFRGEKSTSIPPFRAPLTKAIIIFCTLIYFLSIYQDWVLVKGQNEKPAPFFKGLTKVQENFLYDNPPYFALAKEYQAKYPLPETKEKPTQEQQVLLNKMDKMKPWTGYYGVLTNWKERKILWDRPKFTEIKKGEVWRVITPVFLHANLIHLLFNMLWLWMLGRMIEENMKTTAYFCFIFAVAAVTNTLQYLMTGPFFMGISGVVTAMSGYIWVRKKEAPWEYFPISQSTILLLWFYIFGLVLLQMIVFILQISHIVRLEISMANTAHVSGLLLGLGLAKIPFFQRKL